MSTATSSRLAALLTFAVLIFLFVPLFVVVLFSFHATGGLTFPFQGFSLRWYEEVLGSPEFAKAIRTSAFIAVVSATTTAILGTFAAYGLSRSRARIRPAVALLFFLPLTLPGLFIGISMLAFFAQLGFDLSIPTVIVAHVVFVFPYFLLIARAALDRLDPALEESAADLGASPWVVFRRVTFPQIWPVLFAATALAFALSFDEFIITFFVIGSNSTLPMFIWSSLRRTVDPSVNVISTILMAVTIGLWMLAWFASLRGRRTGTTLIDGIAS